MPNGVEITMKSLPIIGILSMMVLVVSGYVSSSTAEEVQASPVIFAEPAQHLDPHVSYYERHLASIGVER